MRELHQLVAATSSYTYVQTRGGKDKASKEEMTELPSSLFLPSLKNIKNRKIKQIEGKHPLDLSISYHNYLI
jgi:hypothetical protein